MPFARVYMRRFARWPLRGPELPNELLCGSCVHWGTFIAGHAPPSSFDKLVRITRPGGHVIFTARSDMYEGGGFKEKQLALVQTNAWQFQEVVGSYVSVPGSDDDEATNRVFAYHVQKTWQTWNADRLFQLRGGA